MPLAEIEPTPWSSTVMRGSSRATSSIERLPCGVACSCCCEILVDRPLLSEEKVCASAEALTVTAPRLLACAALAPMLRLIDEGWPSCRNTLSCSAVGYAVLARADLERTAHAQTLRGIAAIGIGGDRLGGARRLVHDRHGGIGHRLAGVVEHAAADAGGGDVLRRRPCRKRAGRQWRVAAPACGKCCSSMDPRVLTNVAVQLRGLAPADRQGVGAAAGNAP